MGKVSKSLCLLLVVMLAAVSLLIFQPADAQAAPKPSVPEFTVKLVDSSYDVPATYSTDPYTGERMLVEPAHRVNNGTIELWIKNQQYTYSNGSTFHIYYNVHTGGHFGGGVELYPPFKQALGPEMDSGWFIAINAPVQSNSTYTIISLSSVHPPQTAPTATYPPDAQVDFQVKALVGHDSKLWGTEHLGGIYSYFPAVALDAESDWSNILTINLSDGKVSGSSSPAPSPTVPELPMLAFLPFCMLLFAAALVLKRKHKII
jgi:hypothetical protein